LEWDDNARFVDTVFKSYNGFEDVVRYGTVATGSRKEGSEGVALGLNANLGLRIEELRSPSRVFSKTFNCCIIKLNNS